MRKTMQHFSYLPEADVARLFHRPPAAFDRDGDREVLATALGATLYMPATRPQLAADLRRQGADGVRSSVVCLEDAIADEDVPAAEANVVRALRELAEEPAGDPPLVFVRVRHPEQIATVVSGLGDAARVLSGFVLPKFDADTGAEFLDALSRAVDAGGHRLFGMPVIESRETIYRETRTHTLLGVRELLEKHRDLVLAVRVGATDLCAAYGLRRDRDLTIYDIGLAAEVIGDVVNILGRADGSGFTIAGPVWEYFSNHERLFKPQLRETPFDEAHAAALRRELLTRDLDGLIREVVLDKANGLTGKTVIHPSHVAAVHSLSVVTHEEFCDATDVLGADMSGGGVKASGYRNKMNESKPHRAWAERTLRRAEAFGVAAEDVTLIDLLVASSRA
jgi:citrate lyase beta subunit